MFNIKVSELDNTPLAIHIAAQGSQVFIDEAGRLFPDKGANRQLLLEPINLANYGVVIVKAPEGGYGADFGYGIEPLADDRAESLHIAIECVFYSGALDRVIEQIQARIHDLAEISTALWEGTPAEHTEYLNSLGIDPAAILSH